MAQVQTYFVVVCEPGTVHAVVADALVPVAGALMLGEPKAALEVFHEMRARFHWGTLRSAWGVAMQLVDARATPPASYHDCS